MMKKASEKWSVLCLILALWFCAAALWKTGEVIKDTFTKKNIMAYYELMDRMDNAVERFWRGE
jgi:hypothetical protein